LRFASQIECALYEEKFETEIQKDKFLYAAIMNNKIGSEPILRYRIGLRAGEIEDNEEVARKVFEGHFGSRRLLKRRDKKATQRKRQGYQKSLPRTATF
jgi:hypothetical protein